MKTSNKILTGFFILIFLIPVFALMALKSEIRKGHYTVVNGSRNPGDNNDRGSFGAFKVIKVIAPSPLLKCTIRFSDTSSYAVTERYEGDSAHIYNSGDTLIVQFMTMALADQPDRWEMKVILNLPAAEYLVVENAEVSIPSMGAFLNRDFHVEVTGTGILNLGGKIGMAGTGPANTDSLSNEANEVSIHAINGTVSLLGHINIRHLRVQTQGTTTINGEEAGNIGGISGHLSDSTTVSANWKFIQKMQATDK